MSINVVLFIYLNSGSDYNRVMYALDYVCNYKYISYVVYEIRIKKFSVRFEF